MDLQPPDPQAASEWGLLDKTELRIERIELVGADLSVVASTVADVLGLARQHVIVIDARDDLLALDILEQQVDPRLIAGKQAELLTALGAVPGVRVGPQTTTYSEGMLGWIAGDRQEALEALATAQVMVDQISRTIAGRAIVFSTGPEVIRGQIRDTNKPYIAELFRRAGLAVTSGSDLPDDVASIEAAIRDAGVELGYGIVVTTGGVGAEGKDFTVEALLALDPQAATPVLFTVTPGEGRHLKGQVRIGVGQVGTALVVCLPGPHAEAALGAETLVEVLERTRDKQEVADVIAAALRDRLRQRHAGAPS